MSKNVTSHPHLPPLDWVVQHVVQIPDSGHVLDVACGGGRHTRYLLGLGYRVTAIDRDTCALSDLVGHPNLHIMEHNLEDGSTWPLVGATFDGIVVSNYLYRPLFEPLSTALSTGGVLIYQTFSDGNAAFGKPSNPDFLLKENELLDVFGLRLETIAFHQGYIGHPRPSIVQRICCRKPLL